MPLRGAAHPVLGTFLTILAIAKMFPVKHFRNCFTGNVADGQPSRFRRAG